MRGATYFKNYFFGHFSQFLPDRTWQDFRDRHYSSIYRVVASRLRRDTVNFNILSGEHTQETKDRLELKFSAGLVCNEVASWKSLLHDPKLCSYVPGSRLLVYRRPPKYQIYFRDMVRLWGETRWPQARTVNMMTNKRRQVRAGRDQRKRQKRSDS